MQVTLYYRLLGDRKTDRRIVKTVRAIVAGHERVGIPARGLVRRGLVRLTIPPQLAESANWWMEQATLRGWDPGTEDRWDLRTLNFLTLIYRCGAILVPQDGPNGGYAVRNGGPMSATSTVIPQAKCTRLRVDG